MNKEFFEEVHKNAVIFRNKKREQYLDGSLNPEFRNFVERWDCEPSPGIRAELNKRGIETFPKMFNVNLKEEPLAIDIQLKWGENNYGRKI